MLRFGVLLYKYALVVQIFCKPVLASVSVSYTHLIVMDERCSDVCILQWGRGYSFCINNPKCKTIRITDGTGTYDEVIENDCYPYVFYTNGVPSECVFLDSNGNELY